MTEKQGRLAAYWERQQERFEELERKRARKLPTWRTRRRRRTLSVLVILGDLILITGAALFKSQPDLVFIVVWFAGAVLAGGCHTLLRVLTGKMSGGFSLRLDEREREWRHRVTYVSYQILVALMMISVFYGIFISQTQDSGFRAAMMACALLVTGTTLSPVILGWTLPDDDPEDFDEEVDPA
jgi:MFS family permease